MIKGALILAVGLGIGYAKGISENTLILDKVSEMASSLSDWAERERQDAAEKADAAEAEKDAIESDAIEEESEEDISPA